MADELNLSPEQFEYFRKKIFKLAGISLGTGKRDLVQSRLRSRLSSLRLQDFAEYQEYLEKLRHDDEEWQTFINQLTTNKTDWFREPQHFDFLREKFIPEWLRLNKNELKVWCAASSTGEEPYTLALVLEEALKGTGKSFKVFASDIDTKVLAVAQNGVYPKDQLHQIPEEYQKNLAFGTREISAWMKVSKNLKSKVTFGQFNLVSSSSVEKYDLIFCRNVLIYFNQSTIEQVVKTLYEAGHPDAVLIVSHSESFQGTKHIWDYIRPSIYSKGSIFKKLRQ